MFGKKAAKIEELERRVKELREMNDALNKERYHCEYKMRKLEDQNESLKKELEMIKPVFETPGFKPAVSMRCENCNYAYFSDYDDTLLGCCKDVVCEDFESIAKVEG